MTEIAYTTGATAIDAFSWTYDNANRVATMTVASDGTATYGYDDTNQVTGASYTGSGQPANESYSYDANGNRTNTGYSTGTNNQLSSDGAFNYTYDAESNRITRARISSASANDYLTTYTWDYRNRLTDVRFYDNSSVLTKHVHYTYDVLDHRISKSLDSTGSGSYDRIEDYVYDGNHVVLDFVDPDGVESASLALATRYLNGPGNTQVTDQVFAQEDASTGDDLLLLADNPGTTRDIVDDSSTLVAHFVYNSFGQLASGPTNVTRFLYTGEEWDADVELQYNWHRWYDLAVGRWISQDPMGFGAGDVNVSRYVGNNSTTVIDPSGLGWLWGQNNWWDWWKGNPPLQVPTLAPPPPPTLAPPPPPPPPTPNLLAANPQLYPGYQNAPEKVAQIKGLAMIGVGWYTTPATLGTGTVTQGAKVPWKPLVGGLATAGLAGQVLMTQQKAQEQERLRKQEIEKLKEQIAELQDKIQSIQDDDYGYGKRSTAGSEQYLVELMKQLADLQAGKGL